MKYSLESKSTSPALLRKVKSVIKFFLVVIFFFIIAQKIFPYLTQKSLRLIGAFMKEK